MQEQEPGSGPETPETEVVEPDAPETGSEEAKPEKTLTQAEVDDIVKKVKDREYRKRAKLQRELDSQRSYVPPREPEAAPDKSGKGGEPQRKDFEDFEEYVAAKAAFSAEQALQKRLTAHDQERQNAALEREQEAVEEQWGKAQEKGAAKYADFEDVVRESDAPMTFAMMRSIKESEIGHELAYYLAKHPDEAEEIAGKGVAAQIRSIGRLEEKLGTPKSSTSRPSAPITPVQGRTSPQTELSRNLSNEEWQERWKLREAEKFRRQQHGG